MKRFHVTIHRLPPNTPSPSPSDLTAPFDVTFEAVEQALSAFERLYCEPDGSFVWVSNDSAQPWQLDGHLYDRAERLLYLELKGTCPAAALDRLLATLGWPAVPVVFQLVQEAVVLDEIIFRASIFEAGQ